MTATFEHTPATSLQMRLLSFSFSRDRKCAVAVVRKRHAHHTTSSDPLAYPEPGAACFRRLSLPFLAGICSIFNFILIVNTLSFALSRPYDMNIKLAVTLFEDKEVRFPPHRYIPRTFRGKCQVRLILQTLLHQAAILV